MQGRGGVRRAEGIGLGERKAGKEREQKQGMEREHEEALTERKKRRIGKVEKVWKRERGRERRGGKKG